MVQEQYPPPPPPPSPAEKGLHGPKTNFFPKTRSRLEDLERQTLQTRLRRNVRLGLLVGLVFSGSIGLLVSFLLELPLLPAGIVLDTILGPLIEEPVKALSILIVAFAVWRAVPTPRYGAALGAASGLGFGLVESAFYVYGFAVAGSGEAVVTRILVTPLMHPLWSAFVGIGIYALMAKRSAKNLSLTFPLLFFIPALVNHMLWNSISEGLSLTFQPSVLAPAILTAIIVFPVFALLLRDFLGGHFKFQNFLESTQGQTVTIPVPLLPPPPPPPF
jgi:RsiW-degrading membrane proteinase PrsW (M82 family)